MIYVICYDLYFFFCLFNQFSAEEIREEEKQFLKIHIEME